MTVTNEISFVRYTGDGVAVAFSITFPFQQSSHIKLFINNVLVTTGFTITGGSPTGTITFDAAPADGADIFLRRVVPILQESAYPTNDTFPSITHEQALDELTYIAQQLKRDQSLSLSFPESLNITAGVLPTPVDDLLFGWDGTSGALANSSKTLTQIEDAVDTVAALSAGSGVRVSPNDTTVGFLNGKLVAGSGISLTENNDGGNETLQIDTSVSVPEETIRGRISAGSGMIENLTPAQAREVIDCATAAQGALADTAVQPAGIVNKPNMILGTKQTAAGTETAFDFTAIPAGTKRITVQFVGVSLSGNDGMIVQLGDAGGVETTSYESSGTQIGNTALASTDYSNGFGIRTTNSAQVIGGQLVLTLADEILFTWVGSGAMADEASATLFVTTGRKTLSEELDTIRVTRSGSNTFTAGSVLNIIYEG